MLFQRVIVACDYCKCPHPKVITDCLCGTSKVLQEGHDAQNYGNDDDNNDENKDDKVRGKDEDDGESVSHGQ